MHTLRLTTMAAAAWILLPGLAPDGLLLAQAGAVGTSAPVDFRRDVLPLLEARCFRCHEGRDASSGLRLDVRQSFLRSADGTPLVVPGRSAASRLIQVVTAAEGELRMPPEGPPLKREQVALLRAWIDQGLAWDDSLLPGDESPERHWALQPVVRPPVPVLADDDGSRNPIDRFVARTHRRRGLRGAAEAERRVLIRRLSLDLRGVPPTRDEVDRFLGDRLPRAYARLVDRFLASPAYGQRWARHWLDLARWSESEGYESNHERPFAWRYRDYVVDAFNRDKPYDVFLTEQLAGDELRPYSDERMIATGFLAAARLSSNEEDKWLQRNAVLVDIVNTTGSVFLGLTLGCAQCHDHKFDPLTARDYYRLQGYFLPGQPVNVALRDEGPNQEPLPAEYAGLVESQQALYEQARQAFEAQVRQELSAEQRAALDTPFEYRTPQQELLARRAGLQFQATPNRIEQHIPEADRARYDGWKRRIEQIESQAPLRPHALAFYSPVTSPHQVTVLPMKGFYPLPFDPQDLARLRPYLQIRGDVHQIGTEVRTGWPAIFDSVMPVPESLPSPARRQDLADWMTDPHHPLTSRVWVNRLWQYHFGTGLVATPGDFGLRGARPSHPELLDWLAAELVASGWSTKHIQRLIVTSATYRQSSSGVSREFLEIDPENRYLWHWRPRRLEAELIRDTMLAVSGLLDPRLGGPSVPREQHETSRRRSLYLQQKRGLAPPLQSLLDGPNEAAESCQRRQVTTTALQSLFLLNSRQTNATAANLAERVLREAGADTERQVRLAFACVLGREPDPVELTEACRFLAEFPAGGANAPSPLASFCQVLLNCNEFVYLE